MSGLISKSQAPFVKGRSLADNVHLVQELLRNYNQRRTSCKTMLKVDLRKAFDTVSWDFVHHVFDGLGFPPRFNAWIIEAISTPSYSVVINGQLHGLFKGQKGLRQGDPFSPLLFVLCIEYLSQLLTRDTTDTDYNFHPQCEPLKLTHLAFADDLILLSRGDIRSVEIIMDSLHEFSTCSGFSFNPLKSNVYVAGVYGDARSQIIEATRFQAGSMPFRYLGVPIAASKLRAIDYAPLLEKISQKIACWTGANLSYAGRLELIRAVIQGIAGFWLSLIPLDKGVLESITKLCRNFLWKRSRVAWDALCLPKDEGGLGLKQLSNWNGTFMAKFLWDIHAKSDTLWLTWIHQQFLAATDVWHWTPRSRDSPLIKRLLKVRDTIIARVGSINQVVATLSSMAVNERLPMRLVYDILRRRGPTVGWHKVVWHPSITPKHSFLLWLAARERLPSRDKIRLFLPHIDPSCPLCHSGDESIAHLFFSCAFSQDVWGHIRNWLRFRGTASSIPEATSALLANNHGPAHLRRMRKTAFGATVFFLWKARNLRVFEGTTLTTDNIIHRIKTHVYKVLFSLYPRFLSAIDELGF